MAFASLDFLAVVKPSFCSAYLRGLDRLTIQTSRRGMFVPLLFFSDARTECIVDSDPHPLELPGSQVMVDTLPLGEIGGQHTPLDPTFGDIKDGIEYGPHTQGTRSSTAFGGWDHIFDPLPFLVGQVAWIYFFVHIPILHNPRRLFRQALRGCLKSLHGFLQRYPHAMVIVDFRELRTIVTSSEAALHQLKTLMSGLFKQPLRSARYASSRLNCRWRAR